MPFIGLGLPILLLVNLASAVYWTIRWRCWVFIPLIAIFSNWGYINCVLQFPLLDPASKPTVKVNAYTPGVLTVATYNVDGFNREHTGYSCKEIAAQMRNLKADILCFQEFGRVKNIVNSQQVLKIFESIHISVSAGLKAV